MKSMRVKIANGIALTVFITSVAFLDSENITIPVIALIASLGWLFIQEIRRE